MPNLATESVACDLCDNKESHTVLTTRDRWWMEHGGTEQAMPCDSQWTIVTCNECGLTYTNPRPTQQAIGTYYPQDYYAFAENDGGRIGLKSWVKKTLRQTRLLWSFCQHTPLSGGVNDAITPEIGWIPVGTFLDVGCGSGAALDAMRNFGWNTIGVELSRPAADLAKRKGHEIWNGDLASLECPPASVDVVNMSHVLEHLHSPTQALRRIAELLRPSGTLIVEVPNFSSIWVRVFGEKAWGLDLPRHLFHFSSESLSRLLQECGFEIMFLKLQSTPSYLLKCLQLSLQDLSTNSEYMADIRLLGDAEFASAVQPLCRHLADRGEGNAIRVVARRVGN